MSIHAITTQEIQLIMHGCTPVVTSLMVAEKFGKRHADVLRSIENTKKDCSDDFNQRNFALVEYLDGKGEKRPSYEMTKDGFSMLMMRFTGAKAGAWREKFIDAFNAMLRHINEEIQRKASQAERRAQLEWQSTRATGKVVRHDLTDIIQVFVEYAIGQGSQNADTYYRNVSRMINRILMGEESNKDPHFRDKLDAGQLITLATAERLAGQAILDAMQQVLPYKSVFQAAKTEVTKLAELMKPFDHILLLGGPVNIPTELAKVV